MPESGPQAEGSGPTRKREEAVQGAGMVGLFQARGAAESDASVRLGVRSHVPGTRRDRAQAEEAGNRKAKPISGDVYEQAVVKTVAGFFRGNPTYLFGVTRILGAPYFFRTRIGGELKVRSPFWDCDRSRGKG
jgi:hypothetical protein